MQYRQLGTTELKVSEIGWGAEHVEKEPYETIDAIVNIASEGGINIIDAFMPQPEVRTNLGRALDGRRAKFILQGHIGAIMRDGQYQRSRNVDECDEYIKDFLERFKTDYIDIGMMHFIDTEEDYDASFNSPYIEYAQRLKRDGVIRYLGVSTHDAAMGIKMVNTGLIDVVLFSINPAFDFAGGGNVFEALFGNKKMDKLELDSVRTEFYSLCASKGVGITVMKALGAGRLLSAEASNLGVALTVPQCIAFALDRPGVASVLLGAKEPNELIQCLAYETSTPAERDYTKVMEAGLPLLGAKCMYCNHCLPCPANIDIAAVTKLLDIAKTNSGATINAHYEALTAHAGDCTECGSCERECPFKVNAIENMRDAVGVFGK